MRSRRPQRPSVGPVLPDERSFRSTRGNGYVAETTLTTKNQTEEVDSIWSLFNQQCISEPPLPPPGTAAGIRSEEANPGSINESSQRVTRHRGGRSDWIPDLVEDWLWGPEEAPGAGQGPLNSTSDAPANGEPVAAPATSWWDRYRAESSEACRQQLVFNECDAGGMSGRILELTGEQQRGAYRDAVQEALDFLQLHATLRAGNTDLDAMAQQQADYMTAEDRRLAQQQSGDQPPTQQQLDEASDARNQQAYVVEPPSSDLRWPKLSREEQEGWHIRGQAATDVLVAHIRQHHPEYATNASQIIVDFGEVERLGAVAFNDGQNHCTIGFDMVEAVELNPEFAVSTVVHELYGHNEFDRGFSVSERLFREAVARQRGLPVDQVELSKDEWSRFRYFESEIASLVWEYDLYVGEDAQGHINPLGSPQDLMVTLMNNLQSQWAPELIAPLLRGLHQRFQADPNLSAAAAKFFSDNAHQHLGITP